MKNFVERLSKDAAPFVLSFAMLPSGGLAQVKAPKPESITPEIAAATRNEIRGREQCNSSYPQPSFDKAGQAKPYNGLMACGGGAANFFAIADSLITALQSHKGRPPENLTLEFNAGSKDAKTVNLDGKKLQDIMDEFIKKGIGPEENRLILVAPGEKTTFQLLGAGETTAIIVPTAIITKIPAPRIAELIGKMFEAAEDKRQEKPGLTT
jgi:hypothetical protein